MSFTFNAAPAREHENGAYLGSFSAPGYGAVEYSYYHGDSEWFQIIGQNLYLREDRHFDFETQKIFKYDLSNYSTINYQQDFPFHLTETSTGNSDWIYVQFQVQDVNEDILLTPILFCYNF